MHVIHVKLWVFKLRNSAMASAKKIAVYFVLYTQEYDILKAIFEQNPCYSTSDIAKSFKIP